MTYCRRILAVFCFVADPKQFSNVATQYFSSVFYLPYAK